MNSKMLLLFSKLLVALF